MLLTLFKIDRDDWKYGEYDGFLVAAENETEANMIARHYATHCEGEGDYEEWMEKTVHWLSSPHTVTTIVGDARANVKKGVILSSFHHG